jgi:hypothetical protein
MRTFNVLIFKNGKVEHYDVLPYFRNSWKEKYNKEEKDKIKAGKYKSKRLQLLKDWVIGRSKYMFWARCEYETLLASWPFGSYRLKNEMNEFLKNPVNLDDYTQCLNFENIIIADMEKIDVHDQIMMNINTIVDILYMELKLDKYNLEK